MEKPKRRMDQLIEDFLEGQPRADELKEMADTLATRYNAKLVEWKEMARGSVEWDLLRDELRELREQIEVLRREEAITRFVEDSVRMTASVGDMLGSDEEYEPRDLEDLPDWRLSGFPELDEEE